MPRARRNACRLAGFFVNWVTDAPIGDTQSGFRSYPLGLFAEVTPRSGGFVLETELLVAGVRAGRPIVEVDISAGSRPVRPSRFRPLADGIAIGAYLAACVAGRLARDLRDAGREVARVFSGSRRRARHAEMAEAGASYPDALHLYGAAISGVALRRARARLRRWWRHPGLRRDALVLRAIALSPLMLAAALAQMIAGRFAADLVTPLIDRFYSQDRLAATADSSLPDRLEFPGVLSSPAGQGLDR